MSEISEEATNLIDNFEYAVEDAVSDYTMACGASQKHQARRNLEDYIAELEAERDDWRKSYINLWRHINNLPQPPEVQE